MTIQRISRAEKFFHAGVLAALSSVMALGISRGFNEVSAGAKADDAARAMLHAKGYTTLLRHAAGSSGAKYAFGYTASKVGVEKFDDVRVECVKRAEAFVCK